MESGNYLVTVQIGDRELARTLVVEQVGPDPYLRIPLTATTSLPIVGVAAPGRGRVKPSIKPIRIKPLCQAHGFA